MQPSIENEIEVKGSGVERKADGKRNQRWNDPALEAEIRSLRAIVCGLSSPEADSVCGSIVVQTVQ
jgi:hypothetical protein